MSGITPNVIQIKPTRMDFDFSDCAQYWAFNDPFCTHFMGVLSSLFPVGERFFVDSVRGLREYAVDQQHSKDISGFIGQEAMHSLEHESLNRLLVSRGLPALRSESAALTLLNIARKTMSKRQQLAITVALEHFTGIIANRVLVDTDLQNNLHGKMREVWMWHAIEETEHKAVAFDLYKNTPGNNFLEMITIQIVASVILAAVVAAFQLQFMWADNSLFKPKTWLFGVKKLYGPNGVITGLFSEYIDFFKPSFHPWQHDNSALIPSMRAKLDANHPAVPLRRTSVA